jgi:hypothetical protein
VLESDGTVRKDPRSDPDYPKTHFFGYVHLAEGNIEEVVESFEKANDLSPETPSTATLIPRLARLPL